MADAIEKVAVGHNGLWEILKNLRFYVLITWMTIVGQKFRYGKTFGHSTENALKYKLGI